MVMAEAKVGGTRTQREYNLGLERDFLKKFYELVKPNEEIQTSYYSMAELTGIPSNIVGNVIQTLEKNNLLVRRYKWIGGSSIGKGGGRQAFWTLKTEYDHALSVLEKAQTPILNKRRQAMSNVVPMPVVNERDDSPIAQAKAWADRTRAYMKGIELINTNLQALKDAGIQVDEEAYLASVNIKQDNTLATIALVMPYITQLEAKKRK